MESNYHYRVRRGALILVLAPDNEPSLRKSKMTWISQCEKYPEGAVAIELIGDSEIPGYIVIIDMREVRLSQEFGIPAGEMTRETN